LMFFLGTKVSGLRPESSSRPSNSLDLFIVWLLIALGFILAAGRGETWQIILKSVVRVLTKWYIAENQQNYKKLSMIEK